MTAQTKSEFLLEKLAERLGVAKPTDVAFAPEPFDAFMAHVNLFGGGDLKKRVAEYAEIRSKALEAVKDAEKAEKAQAAEIADLENARERHTQQLAAERAAHERAMAERESAIQPIEQRARYCEAQAMKTFDEAATLKRQLEARLELLRKAAAD
jgi:hypothetical protein